MTPEAPEPRIYRLRGEVAGVERTFDLAAGEHTVGSSQRCDVSLPVRGVSRRHALLRVTEAALVVEDRRSTNGTFVDGNRVERAAVAAGSELRFGPIRLAVELLAAGDGALAIEMEGWGPAVPEPGLASIETSFMASAPAARAGEGGPLRFPDGYRMGRSPAMVALYRQMSRLLRGDVPVLIRGETGVGKELVAKSLHLSSARRDGPFVPLNCSAIPGDLLEAELFGIARAVASGVDARTGLFQQADRGTLFLDEVGEMPQALQAKLLRAVHEREVRPVGGRPRAVDVRILAATNADLARLMDAGRFRRDLYYRLAGAALDVPPLRHCCEEVPGLVEHFLARFAAEAGVRLRGLTVAAMRRLESHSWPGNVRELENEIRRLIFQATDGQVLDSGLLSPSVGGAADAAPEAERSLALEPRLRALEAELIREALRRAGGKPTHAARLLGLSRNGLANKMKRHGITRDVN